jgi:hypothetical protein
VRLQELKTASHTSYLRGPFGTWPAAALCLTAAIFLVLLIVGTVRWYVEVPYWDMWEGYLLYYINAQRLSFWTQLFSQANEHRIALSHLLFWLDIHFFGGRSLFLIPANVILLLSFWLVLCAAARRLIQGEKALLGMVCAGTAMLCFSWLQRDNITIGYQSQFLLAYLVPLIAFLCLATSSALPGSGRWFFASLIFGVLSMGTMANGLVVIPLLVVMQLLLGELRAWKVGLTIAVGVLATSAWFYDYALTVQPRPSLGNAFTFVLSFLGSPFGRIVESQAMSVAAGAAYIGISLFFFLSWWRAGATRDAYVLALLAFVGYVGASAAATAWGRAAYLTEAWRAERYATPALWGWAALAILAAHEFRASRKIKISAATAGAAAALFLLPSQLTALHDDAATNVNGKRLGALALVIGVADRESLQNIHPVDTPERMNFIRGLASFVKSFGVSLFSADADYMRAAQKIGQPIDPGLHPCHGMVESTGDIEGETNFHRLSGWAIDRKPRKVPKFIYFVSEGAVSGVGVTGLARSDVAGIMGKQGAFAGFVGYARRTPSPSIIACADE